ncbi:MAG: hypothetical protein HWE35_15800 [Rhodobacteraceae bacterium]|nr:hypothetical protein [Paracoccaceae bacterium]
MKKLLTEEEIRKIASSSSVEKAAKKVSRAFKLEEPKGKTPSAKLENAIADARDKLKREKKRRKRAEKKLRKAGQE